MTSTQFSVLSRRAILAAALTVAGRAHAQAQPVEPGVGQPAAKAQMGRRTYPITVAGKAIDNNTGNPIKGATVILASSNRSPRRKLAETTTDDNGQYEFRDVALPAATSVPEPPGAGLFKREPFEGGEFQIIGTAPKFAITWTTWYSVNVNAGTRPFPNEFRAGEKISLDITFHPPARIWGRILTEDGKPLSGAELRISIQTFDTDTGITRGPPSAFRTVPSAVTSNLLPDLFRTTTSDSGEFEFASVPPEVLWTLTANHADYGSTSVLTSTAAVPPEQSGRTVVVKLPVELRLRSARVVSVSVQAADTSEPVAGVTVFGSGTSGSDTSSATGKSDEEGKLTLKLPPGSYRLRSEAPAGKDFIPTIRDLVVEQSPAEQSATLKIDRGATLLLKAIDAETGKGIAGIAFWHEPVNAPAPPPGSFGKVRTDLLSAARPGNFLTDARTNAEGEFRAVVAPGQSRCGVGYYGGGFRIAGRGQPPTLPEGYQAVDAADLETGREIETQPGRTLTLEFRLRKVK